jgi:Tol biopolymer transport system component
MGPQGGDALPQAAPAKGGPKAIPVNGRIYFAALITGQYDLYSMKPDGSDRRRITFTVDDSEFFPDVSPDGKKLTYMVKHAAGIDLYSINTDGTGTRRLTSFNADPVNFVSLRAPRWSPDGRKIAFSNVDPATGTSALYTMTTTGTQITRVSPEELVLRIDPEFSPDGSTIVFSEFDGNSNTFAIRTMPASGGPATTLGGCGPAYCYRPSWSPDGTRIFIETGDGRIYGYVLAPVPYDGFVQTGLVDIAGGAVAFAPDGSKFAFADHNQRVLYADVNNYAPSTVVTTGVSTAGLAWGR